MLKIAFLNKIFAYNPGTISAEKTGKKIQKNDFWSLCPGLNSVKMCNSVIIVSHSIPDGSPRKKNKSAIRPGYYLRGLPVNQFNNKTNY